VHHAAQDGEGTHDIERGHRGADGPDEGEDSERDTDDALHDERRRRLTVGLPAHPGHDGEKAGHEDRHTEEHDEGVEGKARREERIEAEDDGEDAPRDDHPPVLHRSLPVAPPERKERHAFLGRILSAGPESACKIRWPGCPGRHRTYEEENARALLG
jgi:hypothetical protein